MFSNNVKNKNNETIKTCFLTGRKGKDDIFMRFVCVDGRLLLDISGCLPLEGYWCLLDKKFLIDVQNRGVFSKAFGNSITISNDFEQNIKSVLYKNAKETIGIIKKTGSIYFGYEKVSLKILNKKLFKVLVAVDASRKIANKMEILALRKGIKVLKILYKAEIEKLLELYNCVYIGLEKDDKLSKKFISYLYLLKSLRQKNIGPEMERAV